MLFTTAMPTNVLVRPAVPAEAEALSVFAAKVFPLGGRPGADPADLEAYFAAELTPDRFRALSQDPGVVLLVAESERQIAGYAALVHDCKHPKLPANSPAELRKLYVVPDHHGRGVADALMRELLLAVRTSADVVWLSVFSENARAIAFYQRWGFRLVGTHDFLVGEDRQKDFLMQRDADSKGTQ